MREIPTPSACELESVDWNPDGTAYAWLRRADGVAMVWHLDLSKPPGQMQTCAVIEGA